VKAGGLSRTTPLAVIAASALSVGAAPPVTFVDLATPFERVAVETSDQLEAARVAALRRTLGPLLPGVYPAGIGTDRRIATALHDFPAQQAGYDRVVHDFPVTMSHAVTRFRTVFPGFNPPLPIYLYHSLGLRDGGSDYLEPGHRHVMFFGADTIARYHADTSLEPFFDHELFHLEHGHAFSDCDQFWCGLWQEGLAVEAADVMTPGATDHQLMLDTPAAIRGPTDARWIEALCFVATNFDNTRPDIIAQALQVGGKPPSGLPDRFGYYVGYRLVQATGQPLPLLDRLGHGPARRLLRAALIRLLAQAKADCAIPAPNVMTSHRAPHAV
jgi:hypothetical protein